MKYTEDLKTQCVELVRSGKTITEVSKLLGPNPNAIARYLKASGIKVTRQKRGKAAVPSPKSFIEKMFG